MKQSYIFIHFLPHTLDSGLNESLFYGWHLRFAHAIYKVKRVPNLLIRLKNVGKPEFVIGVRYLPVWRRLGLSFGYVGLNTCSRIKSVLREARELYEEPVVVVHEWKALNSLILLKCISEEKDVSVILQQHHLPPFIYLYYIRKGKKLSSHFYKNMFKIEYKLLKKTATIKAIYVLNKIEKELYGEIYRDKIVRISTMGTWFSEKPLRRLFSRNLIYVGPITLNSHKGGDVLIKYFIKRKLREKGFSLYLIGPFTESICRFARIHGIDCLGVLPNWEVHKYLSRSSLFVWPASKSIVWGGIGVSPMEAFAHDVPVASPTLIHHTGKIERLGWVLPWREAGEEKVFKALDEVLEAYNAEAKEPYEEGRSFYDWHAIIDKVFFDIKRG